MKNELQIYHYLTKYLDTESITDPSLELGMMDYLQYVRDNYHETLKFAQENIEFFNHPKQYPDDHSKIQFFERFVDSYIDSGSHRIDSIKEMLVPEW